MRCRDHRLWRPALRARWIWCSGGRSAVARRRKRVRTHRRGLCRSQRFAAVAIGLGDRHSASGWDVRRLGRAVARLGGAAYLGRCLAIHLGGGGRNFGSIGTLHRGFASRSGAGRIPASLRRRECASQRLAPIANSVCESSDMVLRDLRRRPVRADCDRRPHLADSLLQHGPRRPIPASGAECIDGAARAGSLARLFWAGCRIASVAGSRSSLRAA